MMCHRSPLCTGQHVAAASVQALPSHAVVSAMQLVRSQQHQYQLAITAQGSGQISCIQLDDAAATEAALATTFAAMHIDIPGKMHRLLSYGTAASMLMFAILHDAETDLHC